MATIVQLSDYFPNTPAVDQRPMAQIELESAPDLDRLSAPALLAFFRIAELWGLSDAEEMALLGVTARSTIFEWKKNTRTAVLPQETLRRISYVVGIYKSLQILFSNEGAADAWVKRPNTASIFAGRSALDRMMAGNTSDLSAVRQYLDAQMDCWV